MIKEIYTGTCSDTGTKIKQIQVDIRKELTAERLSFDTHQILIFCVPVVDSEFDAVLEAVAARGDDGALASQLREAGLDKALERLSNE